MKTTIILRVETKRAIVAGTRDELSAMFGRLRAAGADYDFRGFHDYRGLTVSPTEIDTAIPDEKNDASLTGSI